ncbi:PREDICTED: mediator of RNA polymerase II transcription subunit 9-like [Priapulus caudatus]|uniref:Mediator of RNA polymerase II transcription subunit 9 n=1 Tax=Priapulus caudatus TaxID=37621 RepID=A0ABM1F0R2_PRICU|nr:PREDICTED: mediator of RNA polymerase II transcription subunit 9-like [Priapulus caudatus]
MGECVDVNFLSLIYEIIRSIEKDSHDVAQKLAELSRLFELCRHQIAKLPGIELSKAEQQQQIDVLRKQVVLKNELLQKYKTLCHFEAMHGNEQHH